MTEKVLSIAGITTLVDVVDAARTDTDSDAAPEMLIPQVELIILHRSEFVKRIVVLGIIIRHANAEAGMEIVHSDILLTPLCSKVCDTYFEYDVVVNSVPLSGNSIIGEIANSASLIELNTADGHGDRLRYFRDSY